MSPLHVAGALALFLALSGAAGMIGVQISSPEEEPGPKVPAAENSIAPKAERQEVPARLRNGLTLFKHREVGANPQVFARDDRDANLKNFSTYQSAGAKVAVEWIAVEMTPVPLVDGSSAREAKPIPTETLGETLAAATNETKTKAAEKQPVPKRVAKAKPAEVRKAKTKVVASAAAMPRHKSKTPRKPKSARAKKGRNIENAGERKVAVKEVASPVSRVTEQRASTAIERPAAAEQEPARSNNNSDECRPRPFRSYIAGHMRPCDYW